jgi:2-iminobutanoate/2-iminopropanoate deaminase
MDKGVDMKKQQILTVEAPQAIGPYSQAVRAGGMVFFSGQIPLLPEAGVMIAGGIAEQTRQVMANMKAMLKAAELDCSDVVKTTIYLVDLGDFAVVNEIYGDCFDDLPPARACVQVAALPKDALIEIDWIAVDR